MTEIREREAKNFVEDNVESYEGCEIETRKTKSGSNVGVDVDVYGHWIELKPLIQALYEDDVMYVENISFTNDGRPRMNIFLTKVKEIDDAFVE